MITTEMVGSFQVKKRVVRLKKYRWGLKMNINPPINLTDVHMKHWLITAVRIGLDNRTVCTHEHSHHSLSQVESVMNGAKVNSIRRR